MWEGAWKGAGGLPGALPVQPEPLSRNALSTRLVEKAPRLSGSQLHLPLEKELDTSQTLLS